MELESGKFKIHLTFPVEGGRATVVPLQDVTTAEEVIECDENKQEEENVVSHLSDVQYVVTAI